MKPQFEIAPLDAATRKAQIKAAASSAQDRLAVPYRDTFLSVPVVRLPVSLPIYRANNGRLAVLEGAYLHAHGLPPDHFEIHEETADIQNILHGFLVELSQHPEGPVKQALARSGRQVEPILVDAGGVVVNGNRRLAAMRELYATNPEKYTDFDKIDCGVLPEDTTAADLEAIEAALQLAPETKLAYGWVERRLKMRRQRDVIGLSTAEIVESYQLFDDTQLDRELEELELAERYLRDFVGALDYVLIADLEDGFRQMHETLAGLPELQHDLWEAAGFNLLHAVGRDPDLRPLKIYPFAAPKPPYSANVVLHRLGAELGLWYPRETRNSFSIPPAKELKTLRRLLMQKDQAPAHARLLTDLFDAVGREHREQPDPQLIIRQLESAVRLAARIETGAYSERQRHRIADQLARLGALSGEAAQKAQSVRGGRVRRALQRLARRG